MSDREWCFYLNDMILFCEKVLEYTEGCNQEEFEENGMIYDATLRNLELIGEAATNIPDSIRCTAPDIPWRQIVAIRNRLIHGYLGIDNDILWSIIREDIPSLQQKLSAFHRSSR